MELRLIKVAVARVTTPDSEIQGTAFLVSERLVLTCAHCIATSRAGADLTPRLEFTEWPEQVKRSFDPGELTLLRVDRSRDLAVIELPEPIAAGTQPLKLASDAMLGDSWQSFAYPEPVGDDGLPMDGTIVDTQGRSHGKPRLTLRCNQAADWVRGASGGPIVSGASVVGLLSQQLGARDDAGSAGPVYQTVYGTSCRQIRASFPELAIVDTGPFSVLDCGVAAAQGDYLREFLRFYLGTEALPVGFGGRGDRLRELERWLMDDVHPFGLLVSRAGRGKSALVVRWSDTLRSKQRARVAFVPVSLRYETARLWDTVTVLLTRLRRLLGIAGPPSTSTDGAREEIARLCRDVAERDPPLLVVLDGLDEALEWRRYDYSRLGLPTLPRGLKVLATCRSDPSATPIEILARLGWPQGSVTVFEELLPLSPAAVGEALASITPGGIALPAEIAPDVLHRLSGGDPLLLGLYLEQVANELARGALERLAHELRVREPGWRAYLAMWWEGQCKLWGHGLDDRPAATVLCLLAAARGTLSLDELVALSEPMDEKDRVDGRAFERVLETVGRLVAPVRSTMLNGDKRVALTLSHPQLAPFLRDLFADRYSLESTLFDTLIVDWCRRVKTMLLAGQTTPQDVPDYVLRHLPEHLEAADATIELADLLGGPWRAARHRVDGTDDAFLDDVARAWVAIEETWPQEDGQASDSALRLARCALLAASRVAVQEWPADLIVEMAPFGRWSEGAMLTALQGLRCPSHSVLRAFRSVRERLSRDALVGVADGTDPESLLRLAAAAELARRDGVTALDAIMQRAGGISVETWGAADLVAPWLRPSELANTVKNLSAATPGRGHMGKAVQLALQVADELKGEARSQQLEAIRNVITSSAGMSIWQMTEAALQNRHGKFKDSGPARDTFLWLMDRWSLLELLLVALPIHPNCDVATSGRRLTDMLDAIEARDLHEKRVAQLADVIAGTNGVEAALTRVRSIDRAFLKAKGLARIARKCNDSDLLDEALKAASDHHDSLECAAAALELARLAGDDEVSALVDISRGLIHAALKDPTSCEAWAWATLAKVMTQAERDRLCDALLPALHGDGAHTAVEIIVRILPRATPSTLEAALAVATDRTTPADRRVEIVRAAGASLDAARLAELWQLHSGPADADVRQGIAVPLACKGTAQQADTAVLWCARAGLHSELADIVREARESVARRAWQELLKRGEDGEWLIAALKSGSRFSDELYFLVIDVVAAAEAGAAIADDPCMTYRVLLEGVLPVVPHHEEIGLRAARLAGRVKAQNADGARWSARLKFGWRAQLAVRLPAGAARDALLAETLGIIERSALAGGKRLPSHRAAAKRAPRRRGWNGETLDDFHRLLLQTILQTSSNLAELGKALEEFGDWPLRLPTQDECLVGGAELFASLCAVPPSTLRSIWARSLRVFASGRRTDLARELAAYASLVRHTGGTDTARRLAQELLALPRWWP